MVVDNYPFSWAGWWSSFWINVSLFHWQSWLRGGRLQEDRSTGLSK